MVAAKDEFALAVRAVFPDAEINGFSATIDGFEIHKDGDSFTMTYSFMRHGSLEEIRQIMDLLSKYRERE